MKKWKEDAEKAHEKAVEVHTELSRFLEAVARTKATETATAVKAVLCLVKSIFDDVNDLLRVSTSAEVEKGKIQELRQLIVRRQSRCEYEREGAGLYLSLLRKDSGSLWCASRPAEQAA